MSWPGDDELGDESPGGAELDGEEAAPLLPVLILDELASRASTISAQPGSPWLAVDVIRLRPFDQVSPAHGQVRITVDGPPSPLEGRQDLYAHMHWSMDITVQCFIAREELPPDAEEDTRLGVDVLGFAGIDAILSAIDADAGLFGQGYQQLADTITVRNTEFGQTSDGALFGAAVALRVTFQTKSKTWRDFIYPPI